MRKVRCAVALGLPGAIATPPLSRNCDGVSPLSQNTLRLLPIDLGADREDPMKRLFKPLVALTMGVAVLLGSHPALAHGTAGGGVLGGLAHPLTGLDHLLMLLAVATAAASISAQLLAWALAGGLVGALLGGSLLGGAVGSAGMSLASVEWLAALAIAAVGGLALVAGRLGSRALNPLGGLVVALGVGLHGLLHATEAPPASSGLLWWSGALIGSVVISGGAFGVLRQQPASVRQAAAIGCLVVGGLLAVAPMGLLAGAGN